MKYEITKFIGTAPPTGFLTFECRDGGRVHIPPDQVMRMWNEEQERKSPRPALSLLLPTLTLAQRAADAVTEFCGSWAFISVGCLIVAGWMAGSRAWDPYPFILLNLFLTVVSTFQSPLIMMSQHRQMERDRDAVQGLHVKLDELLRKSS